MKSVSSLVLKKRKVTTIVCVFLRKAPTKNERIDSFPKLKEVARVVLCILPSPANAERAQFLSENRKNRLSMNNLKLRLKFDN